jgi:hypothetical protein
LKLPLSDVVTVSIAAMVNTFLAKNFPP